MNFQSVTRLRRAVTTLWTTRRFIRKDARALKLVPRHVIRNCLQGAGIERAGDAVTSISSSVQERLEMHRSDRTVFLHSGLHVHQHRVSTAMAIENLFAVDTR